MTIALVILAEMPKTELGRDEIKRLILEKMFRNRCVGGVHSERATILRTYRNQREASKAMDELIKEGLVISASKTGEAHVTLNKYRIAEIRKAIGL
jgi:elongation factor P--beta-lysine ligase